MGQWITENLGGGVIFFFDNYTVRQLLYVPFVNEHLLPRAGRQGKFQFYVRKWPAPRGYPMILTLFRIEHDWGDVAKPPHGAPRLR